MKLPGLSKIAITPLINTKGLSKPSLKRIAFLLLVVGPVVAWGFMKPLRLLAPELNRVTCPVPGVCTDTLAELQLGIDLRAVH
jgi:hypothetical protein